MHKLARNIRFSVNPFLEEDRPGYNSYCSSPSGEGLALYFDLRISIAGRINPDTGFIINIVDIDKTARRTVVPIFSKKIRECYLRKKNIDFSTLKRIINAASERLRSCFAETPICDLTLKLNPCREISVDCEDMKMFYITEKFEFAAMHKLWNDTFDEKKNLELFGKCANPTGHGHNYVIDVTVKTGSDAFEMGTFQKTVKEQLIDIIDHKNLNEDIDAFRELNPTLENLASFAWQKLEGKFSGSKLHSITVWESDRTQCTFYG